MPLHLLLYTYYICLRQLVLLDSLQLRAFPGKADKKGNANHHIYRQMFQLDDVFRWKKNGQVKYMYKTNHNGSNNTSDIKNDKIIE